MREILFKAKGYNTDKWYYGLLSGINPSTCSIKQNDGYGRFCDTKTLCQYTGLTDKNGQKIWENDILMCNGNKDELIKAVYGEFGVIAIETGEVVDNVIGWHYEVIETDAISKCEPFCLPMPLTEEHISECEMEVIGNIFNNPELLEGGEA